MMPCTVWISKANDGSLTKRPEMKKMDSLDNDAYEKAYSFICKKCRCDGIVVDKLGKTLCIDVCNAWASAGIMKIGHLAIYDNTMYDNSLHADALHMPLGVMHANGFHEMPFAKQLKSMQFKKKLVSTLFGYAACGDIYFIKDGIAILKHSDILIKHNTSLEEMLVQIDLGEQ